MHPILFRIPLPNWNIPGLGNLHDMFTGGYLPIYSYGVMLGLSLVVGWYLTLWLAEKDGLPKETMANCYVVTAIAALIGARLMYVVTNLDEFSSFSQVIAFRHGGLVAYGGFLGGYLGSWGFLKYKKIPLMPWADVAVPSLASGLGITRIGCYLFGCDFGKPLGKDAPEWLKHAGTFPHWPEGTMINGDGPPAWAQHVHEGLLSPTAPASLPVHPTQIYESLVGWSLLALLLWQRKHQKFRGQVFMLFAFSYGFARFCLEIVRDDAERGMYGPAMAEHVLIPASLAIFAIAYVLSFAKEISDEKLRRVTQVVAFVPAIYAYIVLRPEAYATPEIIQLSTSQIVGLFTAVAVAVAFGIFWKAAEAHPKEAMALHLEEFLEAQEEEGSSTGKKKKKRRKKNKAQHKGEIVEAKFDDSPDDDSDTDEKEDQEADEQVVDAAFDNDESDEDNGDEDKQVVDATFDNDESDEDNGDEDKQVVDAAFDEDESDGDGDEGENEQVVDAAFDNDESDEHKGDEDEQVVDATFDDDKGDGNDDESENETRKNDPKKQSRSSEENES